MSGMFIIQTRQAYSKWYTQYVDEVIIGAPYSITEAVLTKEYKVHIVAHGNTPTEPDLDGKDPYQVSLR